MNSEKLEFAAIKIVARDMTAFTAQGNNPIDYEEDSAIVALLSEGIRPSRLGADLAYIINRAHAKILKDLRA